MNNPRILLVDDDAELRALLIEHLTQEGYVVDGEGDGKAALGRIEAVPYNVILLDVDLPGSKGTDILKTIRSRLMKCRVIMLTGMTGLQTAVECLRLGAVDYITKPCNIEYLTASIRKAIKSGSETS